MNNITTFEDACAFRGYIPEEEIPYVSPKNDRQLAVNAWAKTVIVTEAINADEDGTPWIPNFDTNDYKYENWWWMRSEAAGGSGFSFHGCSGDGSVSSVGARLVFRDRPRAKYFAEKFRELAAGWMVIPQQEVKG